MGPMSRLTKREKQFGILVGIYGLIALGFLWLPHLGSAVPKGGTSPLIPWLIGSVSILLGMGLIVIGVRMPAGAVMAAAAVLGPWSTYIILSFPLIVWAGFVSFKRGARLERGSQNSGFGRKTSGRPGAIDAKSEVRKPPAQSRRYTPPKQPRKK